MMGEQNRKYLILKAVQFAFCCTASERSFFHLCGLSHSRGICCTAVVEGKSRFAHRDASLPPRSGSPFCLRARCCGSFLPSPLIRFSSRKIDTLMNEKMTLKKNKSWEGREIDVARFMSQWIMEDDKTVERKFCGFLLTLVAIILIIVAIFMLLVYLVKVAFTGRRDATVFRFVATQLI